MLTYLKSAAFLALFVATGLQANSYSNKPVFLFDTIKASGSGCDESNIEVSQGILDSDDATQGFFTVTFRAMRADKERIQVDCNLSMPVIFLDKSRGYQFALTRVMTTFAIDLKSGRAHAFYQSSFPGVGTTSTVEDFWPQTNPAIKRDSPMDKVIYSPCGSVADLLLTTSLDFDSEDEGFLAITNQSGNMVAYKFSYRACDP